MSRVSLHVSRFVGAAFVLLLPTAYTLQPTQAHAADCILSIRTQDISIVPSALFLNQSARVYATVQPDCTQDTEGSVLFYANDALVGNKPISYKKAGRAEEVWVNWRPSEYGETTIRVDTKGESGEVGDSASLTLFIDRDTDGDGIGDREDPDDDNDGVPDVNDQFPLDPTKTRDTDHDGIDDSIDSDDDNDGLFDFQEQEIKTNPLKYDTDGDGVGDKQDAFPLDPKRSVLPPPEPVVEPVAAPPASDAEASSVYGPAHVPSDTGLSQARVLGESFENGVATSSLSDLLDVAGASDEGATTWVDWLRGFGLWFLLALTFLSLGVFFFWQDKRKKKEQEE